MFISIKTIKYGRVPPIDQPKFTDQSRVDISVCYNTPFCEHIKLTRFFFELRHKCRSRNRWSRSRYSIPTSWTSSAPTELHGTNTGRRTIADTSEPPSRDCRTPPPKMELFSEFWSLVCSPWRLVLMQPQIITVAEARCYRIQDCGYKHD